jgi:hypothetical protein
LQILIALKQFIQRLFLAQFVLSTLLVRLVLGLIRRT